MNMYVHTFNKYTDKCNNNEFIIQEKKHLTTNHEHTHTHKHLGKMFNSVCNDVK